MFGRLRAFDRSSKEVPNVAVGLWLRHTRAVKCVNGMRRVNRIRGDFVGLSPLKKNVGSLNVPLRSFGGRYDLNSLAGRSVDTVADFRRATD